MGPLLFWKATNYLFKDSINFINMLFYGKTWYVKKWISSYETLDKRSLWLEITRQAEIKRNEIEGSS